MSSVHYQEVPGSHQCEQGIVPGRESQGVIKQVEPVLQKTNYQEEGYQPQDP